MYGPSKCYSSITFDNSFVGFEVSRRWLWRRSSTGMWRRAIHCLLVASCLFLVVLLFDPQMGAVCPPDRLLTFNVIHSVTSQKIELLSWLLADTTCCSTCHCFFGGTAKLRRQHYVPRRNWTHVPHYTSSWLRRSQYVLMKFRVTNLFISCYKSSTVWYQAKCFSLQIKEWFSVGYRKFFLWTLKTDMLDRRVEDQA
jgi:hypothetical protein